ncbi:MAG: ABC transporter [Planctomycetaceae bacterium]|nr:ABC transporter [Planctomycetaceae bacterium]
MNPVAHRECLGTFRSPRSLTLIMVPAILSSGLIAFQWPSEAVISQTGNLSAEVFALFGYCLTAIVCLLTPIHPSVSLVKEKIRGTLQLLFHTPLPSWRIFEGKLTGAVVPLLLTLMMTVPGAAACYTMGGITIRDHLGPLYLVLLLTTVQLSSLALLVSISSRSIDTAVRSSYGWTLGLVIGSLGPYQVLQGSEDQTKVMIADWLRHLSPLPALAEILGHQAIGGQGMVASSSSFTRYLIAASVSIALFAILTMSRLHIRIFDISRDSGTMTEDRALGQRLIRRLLFLVDPQRRSWSIGNWTNPILIKELRCRKFGRATWILRLIAICAVASIALTYFAATGVKNWTVEFIGGLLVVFQMTLIVLLAPGMSAGLIPSEIESGGWAMLRATPQSSFSIALGKLLSAVWTMLLVLCATLPGYLLMIYLKPILEQQVVMVIQSLLLATLFLVVVSAAMGAFFRRSIPATVAAYCVAGALTAVPLLIWMGRDAPFGYRAVRWALLVDPISAPLAVMRSNGFEDYRLLPGNWYFLIGGALVGLFLFWFQTVRLSRPD